MNADYGDSCRPLFKQLNILPLLPIHIFIINICS